MNLEMIGLTRQRHESGEVAEQRDKTRASAASANYI